jgi:hypothetical protein
LSEVASTKLTPVPQVSAKLLRQLRIPQYMPAGHDMAPTGALEQAVAAAIPDEDTREAVPPSSPVNNAAAGRSSDCRRAHSSARRYLVVGIAQIIEVCTGRTAASIEPSVHPASVAG